MAEQRFKNAAAQRPHLSLRRALRRALQTAQQLKKKVRASAASFCRHLSLRAAVAKKLQGPPSAGMLLREVADRLRDQEPIRELDAAGEERGAKRLGVRVATLRARLLFSNLILRFLPYSHSAR